MALPSLASIVVTFFVLKLIERKWLVGPCARGVERSALTRGGWAALIGIVATALLLIVMSALDCPLGRPTCVAEAATALGVSLMARRSQRER